MSDSSKLLLIVATFLVAADTFRRYWKWREGELEQDDDGQLRPIHTFEVAFGIAFVIILLCIYFANWSAP
jgi:hypothetical protein